MIGSIAYYISIAIIGILSFASDYYVGRRLVRPRWGKGAMATYMYFHIALLAILVIIGSIAAHGGLQAHIPILMWVMYAYFLMYLPKFCYATISWIDYLWRPTGKAGSYAGVAIGLIVIIIMIGACVNRTKLEVKEITIESDRLPHSFDGYRIVQFSDTHLETMFSSRFVRHIVETINQQDADLVCFTGDLVNRTATEVIPYQDILSGITARDGVFSIMGNHDYGDYVRWHEPQEKEENIDFLHALEAGLGWTLLDNSSVYLVHGNDTIALIGVENWGEPPFPQHGKLKEAYPDLNDNRYKILLSHNPRHWRAEVLPESNIDLTLSGHTHAMQAIVLGHSLASMRYPEWNGLYQDDRQYLYVNIGVGCIMLPARLGATPEITVITLRCKP